jgi:hypothetical protein
VKVAAVCAVLGIPSETQYHVVLTLTLLSGAAIFFPQVEPFLAKK